MGVPLALLRPHWGLRPGNGGFIESCMEHCAAQGGGWNVISQRNVTMQQAVSAWWDAGAGAPASDHWHLPCTLHSSPPGECNPTCTSHLRVGTAQPV